MKREKLLLQTCCCILLMLFVAVGQNMGNPKVSMILERAKEVMMQNLSVDDIKETCQQAMSVLKNVPSKTVAAVVEIHESSKYGQPIDEKTTNRMKQVHAVAGGKVIKSGFNDKYGLYVQIRHEDGISTYGNLSSVNVVEAERIQRGEIIGSYDSLNEKEFYYELKEDI